MNSTDIIVVGSVGLKSDSIAISACRAGGRGFLQLRADSASWPQRCRLAHAATERFGLACEDSTESLEFALSLPDGLAWIILAAELCREEQLESLAKSGVEIFAEVDSRSQFETLLQASLCHSLAGVILKGNESGGRVSSTTAYILTQQWLEFCAANESAARIPFWVRGGMGPHSAAAALLAGANGVVLDSQLLLTRESPLTSPEAADAKHAKSLVKFVTAMDGSESVAFGSQLGVEYRICAKPGSALISELADREDELAGSSLTSAERTREWKETVWQKFEETRDAWPLFFCGPDLALAEQLAEQFVTVAGVMQGIADAAQALVRLAADSDSLTCESPLAEENGTQYPILQGPMTRVSDVPEFAEAVSKGGALPFLALALLRGQQVDELLERTGKLLGDHPWGVGLLGFLPPEIRDEQVRAIKKHRPKFAIIAGGRPDQAKELEQEGTKSYLHVPSPGLLSMFLRSGAKRFILEGRECGGHVGPRTSFLLWEQQVQILEQHLERARNADQYHVIFAGGIHHGVSAGMAVTMAARLAEKGVRVGVLMGTAYLFTEEAVATKAIVPRFQNEVLAADETVLFETGPGHAVRCLRTPYYNDFVGEKVKLKSEGKSHNEIVAALERMNIGRLRVASKGVDRKATEPGAPRQLTSVESQEQFDRGMYMVGQVASMHRKTTTIAELHQRICDDAQSALRKAAPTLSIRESKPKPEPCDVAIVGMSCFYPGATSLREYWDNILHRVYAVTEVPASHWDYRLYYDEDPLAKDKIVSKWGGFLSDIPFDPLEYGITPKSIESIEPLQLLLLEAFAHALRDAGYDRRSFDRENTCAVLGIGGGGSPMGVSYGFRTCLPMLRTAGPQRDTEALIDACKELLPEWTEDSFPGFLMNVAVGRVANRFDLGGSNYALDAACASSLAAVHACIRELQLGTANVAFAMGADTVQTPYSYMAFSKTHALSPRGRCRPFDAEADGIVLSEGLGVVMLKRLADAERDGDKIYSVIRGIGSSSDGKDKGLTAPNAAGQIRALRRAYDMAGIPPRHVGLVEAHGTGTVVGDRTESTALATVMSDGNQSLQSCALGSVKSMIGHSKCAAGVAGLIKAAKALHHKVLPPTLAETPNETANFEQTALYLNTESRPWIHDQDFPRTAGVSAFGFGGTNVHLVMEEYTGGYLPQDGGALERWPSELFVFRDSDVETLNASLRKAKAALTGGAQISAASLAASLWNHASRENDDAPVVAVVAESTEQLCGLLDRALELIAQGESVADPRGVFFNPAPKRAGDVAFLFSGQGSQYPNMMADLSVGFPEVRETIDAFARAASQNENWPESLGRAIYPPSTFTDEAAQTQRQSLARTDIAQPAIGAVSVGASKLLNRLGVVPDLVGGHSYGEYPALWAAGVIDEDALMQLSFERGRALNNAAGDSTGGMMAISDDAQTTSKLIAGIERLSLANLNAPDQTVISGAVQSLEEVEKRCSEHNVKAQRLRVACAFHSPEVSAAEEQFHEALASVAFDEPRIPVYANATGQTYDNDPDAIRKALSGQITASVKFQSQIEAMFDAGARTFVEVGPHNHLTNLVKRILPNRDITSVSVDVASRNGLTQLQRCLAELITAGVSVNIDGLFAKRNVSTIDIKQLTSTSGKVEYSPMTHMINGFRSRPWQKDERPMLGQMPAIATPNVNQPEGTPEIRQDTTSSEVPRGTTMNIKQASNGAVPTNGHVARPISPPNGAPSALPAGVDPVMLGFQELMSQFLDTQRDIMLQYLGSAPPEQRLAQSADRIPASIPEPPASVPPASPSSNGGVQPIPTYVESHSNGAVVPASNGAVAHAASESSAVEAAPLAEPTGDLATMEEITSRLLSIVSERTGYPTDMLDLELDLEADLGIDSIKRVEILGELAEGIDQGDADESALELEKLTTKRTLRGMLEYLEEALFKLDDRADGDTIVMEPSPSPPAAETESLKSSAAPVNRITASPESAAVGTEQVQRALVRLVDVELPLAGTTAIPSGAILITDDGRGLAVEMADQLADFGQSVFVLRHQRGAKAERRQGLIVADLTCETQIENVVELVRESTTAIAGLIHLLPLSVADDSWATLARRDVRSLYLLSRALEKDLNAAAKHGNALLLAATGLGGDLGFRSVMSSSEGAIRAGQGGVLGFAKCVAMEWPDVMVRVVDVDPNQPVGEVVSILFAELADPNGPLEVGNDGERRVTWEPQAAPLDPSIEPNIALDGDSVVLLTGGARGITAAIGIELARQFQSTLILVGRSELEDEPPETQGLEATADIKKALLQKIAAQNGDGSPMAKVESAYKHVMRCREMRANTRAMESAGSAVEYYSVDVRDEASVRDLLTSIHSQHGKLTGVIHGAGVIEDKLVRDKTPESLDRVFGTKVESTSHLIKHLSGHELQFLALFSSVASRYGNRGQADYAAANEVLSKLAAEIDSRWPTRTFAVAWGPWASIGMVANLEQHLAARGVTLIAPEIGTRHLIHEILYGEKGACEVIIAGGASNLVTPSINKASSTASRGNM